MPGWILLFGLGQGSLVAASAGKAHKLWTVIPFVKCTLLFALIASFWCPVSFVVRRASHTLSANKSSGELTELAAGRLAKLGNILLTSLADAASFTLAFLLELCSTISTFHNRKVAPTFLAQLLSLAEFFKGMSGETLGASVQLGLLSTHGDAGLTDGKD